MKVKVYSYFCKFPYPEEAAHFEHQFTLKHRHRNSLTEILLKGREAYRAIIKDNLGLDVVALEKALEAKTSEINAIKDEIASWKQRHTTRKTHSELAGTLQKLISERKTIFAQIKAAKTAVTENPLISPLIQSCNDEVNQAIKTTRNLYSSKLGLYWPNYLDNERSASQARFQKMDPHFNRWTGEGDLSIQFQGGLLVSDLFECQDSRLRLIHPDSSAIRPNGQIRGAGRHVRAQYRVQSNDDGSPRWITLDATVTRVPPPDAIIKWAHLSRVKSSRAIGKGYVSLTKDYDYTLRLTVEEEPQLLQDDKGKVMIEVGWKKCDKGLLVARWLGADGDSDELHIPQKWLDGKRKAEDLASIIDKRVLETVRDLKIFYPPVIPVLAPCSDNPRKLAGVLLKLHREQPKLQNWLEPWRKKHLHLLRWKKGLNDHLMRSRRERYRQFVCELSKKYSVCRLEDFDLRNVTKKDIAKNQVHDLVKWQRNAAAISSLKMMLSQRFTIEKYQLERRLHALFALKKNLSASR